MKYLLISLLLWCAAAFPAHAEEAKALKGVALVIGQSKYSHLPALPNPANDAKSIGDLLEKLGFEVTAVSDRDGKKLKRDLERFSEDAEGADVALVYYSGHGIEAGGDNWLVPIDADVSSLEDVEKTLVPLSATLDELKSTVPVTIFLVDACRSNPFPPGALAKKDGKPVEVAAGGLGTPRGFAPVGSDSSETLGTLIGYAAEPGQPALDGAPGENSPYAAAILRHLSALQGQEFGLVMRMVTEEVYLKTGTKQRPWVNESLRKQLFFGAPGQEDDSPEGQITGERRKLLLTISDLPDAERKKVEDIAKSGGVPLDTLYGVLKALGEKDLPKDPAQLDALLKAQAARLKDMVGEQNALSTDDPELAKLVSASDQALKEGAIETARKFLEQAKAHIEQGRATIETVEAKLKAKKIANAEVMDKSAAAAELDFDFLAAAKDYNAAFDWVKNEDPLLAAKYLTRQADALQSHGTQKGDTESLHAAVTLYQLVYREVPPEGQRIQWAKTQNNLANTYLRIGEIGTGTDDLDRAVAIYRDILAPGGGLDGQEGIAITQSNLGIALHDLALRRNDADLFAQSRTAFLASIAARGRDADPLSWAQATVNLASLDFDMASRSGDVSGIKGAAAEIEEALTVLTRAQSPVLWAKAKFNLGIAYRVQGANAHDVSLIEKAIAAYTQCLEVFDRKTFPLDWAQAQASLAIAMTNKGAMSGDINQIAKAIPVFKLAFEEMTKERVPDFWARTMNSYGLALQVVGSMNRDEALTEQAAEAYRGALTVRSREVNAVQWAETQALLASTTSALATSKGDIKMADEAVAAYRATLEVYTRDKFPDQWRSSSAGLATTLQGKGIFEKGDASMKEAEVVLLQVLDATSKEKAPLDWASAMKDVATIQFMLGTKHMVKAEVEQALASYDKSIAVYQQYGSFMDKLMITQMRNTAAQALTIFK
ncbi:caspase family protein [Aestuariivirga sp.]|uniref:caspase family protein n=1 Tax=Aestuariivirga sp. TaxID=2650926 RepID=UPI0039E23B5B